MVIYVCFVVSFLCLTLTRASLFLLYELLVICPNLLLAIGYTRVYVCILKHVYICHHSLPLPQLALLARPYTHHGFQLFPVPPVVVTVLCVGLQIRHNGAATPRVKAMSATGNVQRMHGQPSLWHPTGQSAFVSWRSALSFDILFHFVDLPSDLTSYCKSKICPHVRQFGVF